MAEARARDALERSAPGFMIGPIAAVEALTATARVLRIGISAGDGCLATPPHSARLAVATSRVAVERHARSGHIVQGEMWWSKEAVALLGDSPLGRFCHWERRPKGWQACFFDETYATKEAPFVVMFREEVNHWIKRRREADTTGRIAAGRAPLRNQLEPNVSNDLYGVALSGGGMRAGVFSLGVGQALHRYGLLQPADYFSSVSGGGYFGISLQALSAEALPYQDQPRLGVGGETGFAYQFPRDSTAVPGGYPVHGPETPALWHVRKYAKLLGGSIGIFDSKSWSTVGRAVASLLMLWLLFLLPIPVIFGAACVLLTAVDELRFDPSRATGGWLMLGAVILPGVALLTLIGLVGLFDRFRFGFGWMSAAGAAAAAVLAILDERGWCLAAAVLAVLALAVLQEKAGARERALHALGLTWLAFVVAVAVGYTAWILYAGTTTDDLERSFQIGVGTTGVASASVVALALRWIWSEGTSAVSSESFRNRVAGPMLAVSGYILLFVIMTLVTWGMAEAYYSENKPRADTLWFRLPLAAAVLLLLPSLIPVRRYAAWLLNRLSLSDIYADRVTQTWVVGAVPPSWSPSSALPVDWSRVWARFDLKVRNLAPGASQRIPVAGSSAGSALAEWSPVTPYPLICTAVNIPGSRGERLPERLADSFVLAPFYSGSALTRWARTDDQPDLYEMALGLAAGTSGAAFSPNIGEKATGRPAKTISIAATIFNARIGRWVRNPLTVHNQRWYWRLAFRTPLLMYGREMFGIAARDDPSVYLTDGGHFDNLGLYELLRRRCRFIIAVSADIESGKVDRFGNLADAVRMARVDFGAQVEMPNLRPLTRNDAGRVLSSYAVGVVRYPPLTDFAVHGTLVLIKTGLVENELSPDLLGYTGSNSGFPYDPTTDQQYDQPQFESYRQLGYLAGRVVGVAAGSEDSSLETRFAAIAANFEADFPLVAVD